MKQAANNLASKMVETLNRPLRIIPPGKRNNWQKLAVTGIDEIRFLSWNDIIYCRSVSNYTTIFTRQGRSFTCCKTLKDIESRLPAEMFIRIHASYLVNMQDITALKGRGKLEVEVNNGIVLPVSRLKRKALQTTLGC